MKSQQCEWCEAVPTRKYVAKDRSGYVRYCCANESHRKMLVRLLEVDGVKSVRAEEVANDPQNK